MFAAARGPFRRLIISKTRVPTTSFIGYSSFNHHRPVSLAFRPSQPAVIITPRRLLANSSTRLLSSTTGPQQGTPSGGKLKEMYQKYGRLAILVYLSMSCTTFSMIYVAIWNGIDVKHLLSQYLGRGGNDNDNDSNYSGSDNADDNNGAASQVDIDAVASKGDWSWERVGTTFVVAFAANKLLTPIKLPLTAFFTPAIAKWLKRIK
jgi:hypothetical protein